MPSSVFAMLKISSGKRPEMPHSVRWTFRNFLACEIPKTLSTRHLEKNIDSRESASDISLKLTWSSLLSWKFTVLRNGNFQIDAGIVPMRLLPSRSIPVTPLASSTLPFSQRTPSQLQMGSFEFHFERFFQLVPRVAEYSERSKVFSTEISSQNV